jgi:hypothetical protein
VPPVDRWPTVMWWAPPPSPREDLEAERPLTHQGWRPCTVEPAGICPVGPGVTHGGSRWIAIEPCWVPGRLWPAPNTSGSRSNQTQLRPDRGTAASAPNGAKVGGHSTSRACHRGSLATRRHFRAVGHEVGLPCPSSMRLPALPFMSAGSSRSDHCRVRAAIRGASARTSSDAPAEKWSLAASKRPTVAASMPR